MNDFLGMEKVFFFVRKQRFYDSNKEYLLRDKETEKMVSQCSLHVKVLSFNLIFMFLCNTFINLNRNARMVTYEIKLRN